MKELKNQFMQGAFLTIVWLTALMSLGFGNVNLNLFYFWHIIGIAVIAGGVFGVAYPYLWNYGTWSAPINILVMTLLNFLAGFAAVYLFSVEMFQLILPFWWAILLLNLILHVIAFYFYRNQQNKKIAAELNQLGK
ncbi:hypothetical protein [Enterococcus sp. LJL90]